MSLIVATDHGRVRGVYDRPADDLPRVRVFRGIPFAAHMRWKGKNPAPWTERACSELLDMSVSETSDLVLSALQAFLDSWQGPEEDKWTGGYLAVRENIKQRLMEKLSVRSRSSAAS